MTSRIRAEPPGPVQSLDELLAIAHAMEADASTRYVEIARVLRQRDAAALAEVFEHLAAVESGHVEQVGAWANELSRTPPAERPPPWPIPDTFDAPLEESEQSRTMTPYTALSAAVRHEERSFAFWSYVAAQAPRADVRAAAEKMAHEELEHVSLLRRERRQAYHAQRRGAAPVRLTVAKLADLESALAARLRGAAATAASATRWNALADEAETIVERLRQMTAELDVGAELPDLHDDLLAQAEFLVEIYLGIAEAAKDEDLLSVSQELGASAIRRLATLRSLLAQS